MIKDKTIVITGGSEGLGFELAKRLSPKNRVYILARTKKNLLFAAKSIKCRCCVCDVSNWESVSNAVNSILARESRIDVLVNSAGQLLRGKLDDCAPEKLTEVFCTNSLGAIYMSRAIAPTMKLSGSGSIVFMNSRAGLMSSADKSVYNASKWAMTGFARCLFEELSPFNIRVMSIFPSLMKTKMCEKAGVSKNFENALDPSDVAKSVVYMLSQKSNVAVTEHGMMSVLY